MLPSPSMSPWMSPSLALETGAECVERQSHVVVFRPVSEQIYESGKLLRLIEILRHEKRQQCKCVIFTQMNRALDLLEKVLNTESMTYVRLDGSTKPELRQGLVNRFNSDPRIFVFLSSTRAGGVGINLTGASVVIFFDTDWNPAIDRQATDRCHRLGQTKDVRVYRLICENTVEENIWRKQLQKRQLDALVIDQGKFTTADLPFDRADVADLLYTVCLYSIVNL